MVAADLVRELQRASFRALSVVGGGGMVAVAVALSGVTGLPVHGFIFVGGGRPSV